MPNRARRKSVADMLAKVPVQRGSLLKGIDDLLRTIEMSESAVMIPTLLRDKCQFDAWELLLVAKILKASILGHSDLVEFYMNHIGGNQAASQQHHQAHILHQQQQQQLHQQHLLIQQQQQQLQMQQQGQQQSQSPSLATIDSAGNSVDSSINGSASLMVSFDNSVSQSSGSLSWATANNTSISSQNVTTTTTNRNQSASIFSVASNGSSGSNSNLNSKSIDTLQNDPQESTNDDDDSQLAFQMSREIMSRPTHFRRAANIGTSSPVTSVQSVPSVGAYNIEQLASRLESMQAHNNTPQPPGSLSISITPTSMQPDEAVAALRTSRSAGCLSRIHSGASSPRAAHQHTNQSNQATNATAPNTPLAQPDNNANFNIATIQNDPNNDQSSEPVKLLLQIEQLKSSINHVKNLLESVVELYKRSIDNISLA